MNNTIFMRKTKPTPWNFRIKTSQRRIPNMKDFWSQCWTYAVPIKLIYGYIVELWVQRAPELRLTCFELNHMSTFYYEKVFLSFWDFLNSLYILLEMQCHILHMCVRKQKNEADWFTSSKGREKELSCWSFWVGLW